MNKLYPIIRRVRKPLLPPEEVKPAEAAKVSQPASVAQAAETEEAKASNATDGTKGTDEANVQRPAVEDAPANINAQDIPEQNA